MLGSALSEHLKLTEREIIFEEFQRMSSQSINVTDRRTDGRTDDMRSQDRALHCSASRGKKNCRFNTSVMITPIKRRKRQKFTYRIFRM